MDENHPNAVEQLKKLLGLLPNHKYTRALEVACGRGLLTKDLLSTWYAEVDMFDKSSEAIEEAEDNNIGSYNVMVT